MKPKQQAAIEAHGKKLLAIFPKAQEQDPVKLCKMLRRLETKAGAIALRLCNGPEYPGGYDQVDDLCDIILVQVNKLLGNNVGRKAVPIFLNRDPRGYALKIDDAAAKDLDIHKDWGGYGILAPEIK